MTQTTDTTVYEEIAVTAVREFCNMPRPTKADITRVADLVLPLLKTVRDDGRRQIAAMLAVHESAPKSLLLAMCDFPVAICSPILTRCRLLTPPELLAILSQNGPDHARAIARRRNLEEPVVHALRMMENEGVDRALDLRQRLDNPLPEEQARSFDTFRDELQGDLAEFARPSGLVSVESIIAAARDPEAGRLHDAVSHALAITSVSAAALCANPTSRNLIFMMRFIGASPRQALQILTALAPDLAADPAIVRRFEAVFEEITVEEAVQKVWTWRSDDLLALARQAFGANDSGTSADIADHERARIDGESYMKVA